MEDQSIKDQFQEASTRDKRAAEYFISERFYKECKGAIEWDMVTQGRATSVFNITEMQAKPQDMPHIQATFDLLKKEYPELNHVRFTPAKNIIFDKRPNTLLHRVESGVRYNFYY